MAFDPGGQAAAAFIREMAAFRTWVFFGNVGT